MTPLRSTTQRYNCLPIQFYELIMNRKNLGVVEECSSVAVCREAGTPRSHRRGFLFLGPIKAYWAY
jgi:hypothetical protein